MHTLTQPRVAQAAPYKPRWWQEPDDLLTSSDGRYREIEKKAPSPINILSSVHSEDYTVPLGGKSIDLKSILLYKSLVFMFPFWNMTVRTEKWLQYFPQTTVQYGYGRRAASICRWRSSTAIKRDSTKGRKGLGLESCLAEASRQSLNKAVERVSIRGRTPQDSSAVPSWLTPSPPQTHTLQSLLLSPWAQVLPAAQWLTSRLVVARHLERLIGPDCSSDSLIFD